MIGLGTKRLKYLIQKEIYCFYKQTTLYIAIDMMRRRRLITHPSHAPERRIVAKPRPKPAGIVDLANKRDERTLSYLERAKKRKL